MGRISSERIVCGVFGALCALGAGDSASAKVATVGAVAEIAHTQPPVNEAERLLLAHNSERARLGLPALIWNPALARDAAGHAKSLAEEGRLRHASATARNGRGENLWMGTAGAWNSAAMVAMFIDERRHFRAAAFPDVSVTGNWYDVGHYSQIVWRDTREVGCAVETGQGNDVLVCRYYPAGNVMGQAPY